MPASDHAVELVRLAALAAADKKASDLTAFDVSERLAITDAFLLCSASNERQVGAVVDAIIERLLATGAKPVRREGERENRWVLLDYTDIVVHVQHAEERAFYSLERLWRDCPEIPLPEGVRLGQPASGPTAGTGPDTDPDGPSGRAAGSRDEG